MLRHKGRTRTLSHNLKIASLLSLVAGMVNVMGFLSIQRLTTNVTGHFAYFVDEVFKLNAWESFIFFLYIFFFFLGSFTSNFLIEWIGQRKQRLAYVTPILIEAMILFFVAVFGIRLAAQSPHSLAFLLLFAMGLQNSLVTTISNAAVRTTHLTGLFTDLGIELSQLFFFKLKEQRSKLYASIKLRLTIISFFFLGGLGGGIVYSAWGLSGLAVAGLLLLAGTSYDSVKFRLLLMKRKRRT
jgi:uncharacterized membrane protein YoaK (UPF0700 family)